MAAKKTFLLRIDPALWEQLERWAAEDFRSVNGQVEYLLHQALAKRRGSASAARSNEPLPPPTPDAPK